MYNKPPTPSCCTLCCVYNAMMLSNKSSGSDIASRKKWRKSNMIVNTPPTLLRNQYRYAGQFPDQGDIGKKNQYVVVKNVCVLAQILQTFLALRNARFKLKKCGHNFLRMSTNDIGMFLKCFKAARKCQISSKLVQNHIRTKRSLRSTWWECLQGFQEKKNNPKLKSETNNNWINIKGKTKNNRKLEIFFQKNFIFVS